MKTKFVHHYNGVFYTADELTVKIKMALITCYTRSLREFEEKYGNQDQLCCGFAWTKVYDVKLSSRLGKVLQECGFSKSYSGGIEYWNPGGLHVQNVDIKLWGANLFAEYLRNELGLNAYGDSRLD